MAKLLADSGDPDQTPRSAASDLGLHCLPIIPLRVLDYNGSRANYIIRALVLHVHWYFTVAYVSNNKCTDQTVRKCSLISVGNRSGKPQSIT